ncbi:MAG TPA: hypothetical protein VFH17_05380 [Coriobacteriia bacterium]|nr:hypothetical protein [Coriobacteriia bacterium]
MAEITQRTDGIPVAEVARMFGTNIDTMRKRIDAAGLATYTIGRARYVEMPDQWPVAWGEPVREPSGTAVATLPETSGAATPTPGVLADLFLQVGRLSLEKGKLEEKLNATRRDLSAADRHIKRLLRQIDELEARGVPRPEGL